MIRSAAWINYFPLDISLAHKIRIRTYWLADGLRAIRFQCMKYRWEYAAHTDKIWGNLKCLCFTVINSLTSTIWLVNRLFTTKQFAYSAVHAGSSKQIHAFFLNSESNGTFHQRILLNSIIFRSFCSFLTGKPNCANRKPKDGFVFLLNYRDFPLNQNIHQFVLKTSG